MCELLAISSRVPATIGLSFGELAEHGGGTGPHADGWGAAFFSGRDAVVYKEPSCSAKSALAHFVRDSPQRACLMIAHIRQATAGDCTLANTQPFVRELGGHQHVFAHNGHVPRVVETMPLGSFRPIGETDSEYAFCALLARLEALWRSEDAPTPENRAAVVRDFARDLRDLGPANFIYSDSELLFVHAHRRPKKDDDEPTRPGLYRLTRTCAPGAGAPLTAVAIGHAETEQTVQVVATVPLSDEAWQAMGCGELLVLRNGEPIELND